MDHKSLQALRLDRRLLRRAGWIGEKDLERELEALPDVSQKAAEIREDKPEKAAARDEAAE